MANPLKDERFLNQLFSNRNRNIYIKLISLNRMEQPLEELEGRATSGSISINGDSAIRRTCNLTLVAQDVNITDYYWTLNTKFKVFVGLENTIEQKKYDKIIWFPQGTYIITSFSCSINSNSFNINISGKDKMCMLNGENGGIFSIDADLDTYQVLNETDNTIQINQLTISEIIFNLVNQYGGELINNIIIEDLEQKGYSLLEYKGDKPLYLWKNERKEIQNILQDEETEGWMPIFDNNTKEIQDWEKIKIKNLPYYDTTSNIINVQPSYIVFAEENELQDITTIEEGSFSTIIKISSGQPLGYWEEQGLYYPIKGSLRATVGGTIVSVLDQIKNFLGEYEYFYDLDGKFVFREKRNYLQTSWTPVETDNIGQIYINSLTSSPYSYSFEGSDLITSISFSPRIDNIKNDYCIWGEIDTQKGKKPIHLRCAIDKKPTYYCSPWFHTSTGTNTASKTFITKDYIGEQEIIDNAMIVDWRELIFQMAIDYNLYNQQHDFLYVLRNEEENWKYYPDGQTGYEQYYPELLSNWRTIYNPFFTSFREEKNNNYEGLKRENYFLEENDQLRYWTKTVLHNPEALEFWFEFLEFSEMQELKKYEIKNIGIRPKAAKEKEVKAIFYRDVPGIILQIGNNSSNTGTYDLQTGWKILQISQEIKDKYLSVSSQGKSAHQTVGEYLNKYTNALDSISISCVPVYSLEPNTKIQVNDQKTGISGEYIINTLSIPLSYNGIMTIGARKVINSIY